MLVGKDFRVPTKSRVPRDAAKRPPAANQFRRDAKVDEGALIRIAFGFCTGAPLPSLAQRADVSVKTARAIVLRLRGRLAQPKFNRWHAAYQKLPKATSPDEEYLAREAFFDTLGACYANTTCFRNFSLGNRVSRLCRSCPLAQSFHGERLREALDVVDAVHAFYSRMGLRGEAIAGGSQVFYLRLIHTTTVATALASSLSADGRLDRPRDIDNAGFLSVWTLLDALLEDLAANAL